MRADVWRGFEFTDVVQHAERYPDGEVKPLEGIRTVLPTICGRTVPTVPASSPQVAVDYDYPEAGTQRGVAAFPSDGRARAALRSLRSALARCTGRDGSGPHVVRWRSRAVDAGDEALAVSAVSVRPIGKPPAPPYLTVEEVLAVRVGSVLWIGRERDVSLTRRHFQPYIQQSLRRGFAAVEADLRKRG